MRLEKTMYLNSVGEHTQGCGKENRGVSLLVKHLRCINCLNAWPNNWVTL